MGPLTTFSIESRCVCSCQSLLDIFADVFHNAQHPTCNDAPLLDALFALFPVQNDLSPKGHTRIIGCLFHLGGGDFVTADAILAFLLRWGGCLNTQCPHCHCHHLLPQKQGYPLYSSCRCSSVSRTGFYP